MTGCIELYYYFSLILRNNFCCIFSEIFQENIINILCYTFHQSESFIKSIIKIYSKIIPYVKKDEKTTYSSCASYVGNCTTRRTSYTRAIFSPFLWRARSSLILLVEKWLSDFLHRGKIRYRRLEGALQNNLPPPSR